MKQYLIKFKINVRKRIYTVKFYNFFEYFSDGQVRSLFSNPFFNSLFSLTGFLTLRKFKESIKRYVFDEKQKKEVSFKNLSLEEKITSIIMGELFESLKILTLKSDLIRIVLFPTFSRYLKNKLFGISAYTVPSGKIYFIFIHPQFSLDKISLIRLKKTVAHEFNHLIFEEYHHDWEGAIDNIISEGLAGHFEAFVSGCRAEDFFRTFSRKRCLKSWPKVKKILYSYEWSVYDDLFNRYNKNFPLNFGYSLGYQIVGDFLKKNKGLSWSKIMKMSSQEILEKSGWLDY